MAAFVSMENLKTGEFRAVKLGSKIVQVKGFMPPEGGINRQTPTGRAVGQFYGWHNFFGNFEKVMSVFLFYQGLKGRETRNFYAIQ